MERCLMALLPLMAILSYTDAVPAAQRLVPHMIERRAATENNVEVLFVLDNKAFQIFVNEELTKEAAKTAAEKEIDYYVTQLNARFASMTKHNLNVKISKRGLIFLDSDIFSSSTLNSGNVDAPGGLNDFDKWLSQQNAAKQYNYDHALLFTGYELNEKKTGNKDVAGLAWMDGVCSAKASSIVEFTGTYDGVLTAAHEIGHNLGADHDGQASGYIMTPTGDPKSENKWDFSLSSASDITGAINEMKENCMKSSNSASTSPNVGVPKNLGSTDAVCKRIYGKESYMCHDTHLYVPGNMPKGNALCTMFYCSKPGSGQCHGVMSSEGSVCGSGKSCQKGSCKADANAPTGLDDNCLFGDSPSLIINNEKYTCATAIDTFSRGSICEGEPFFKTMCCGSCKGSGTGTATTASTGNTGTTAATTGGSSGGACEWEMFDNCADFELDWICTSEYKDGCCKTCANFKTSFKRELFKRDTLKTLLKDVVYGSQLKEKKKIFKPVLTFTPNQLDPEDIEKAKKLEQKKHKQVA